MLVVTVLVAWSVASVASATPVKVIHSALKSTTRDMTSVPISSPSVMRMDSSYRTYSSEERVGVSEEIVSIVRNAQLQPVSEIEQIRNVQDAIKETSGQTAAGVLDEVTSAIERIRSVKSDISKEPAIAKKEKSIIVAQLFKSLMLQQPKTETNSISHNLFLMWVRFVESRYPNNAYEHMISVLTDVYEKNDLKVVNALDAMTYGPTKKIAEELLKSQVKKWEKDKRNDAELFNSLMLQQPSDNLFESVAFKQWDRLLYAKYEKSYEVYPKMYDILMENYRGNNLESLMIRKGKLDHRNVGRGLLKMHAQQWKSEQLSSNEVFDKLDLGKKDKFSNPLKKPLFEAWAHFVKLQYRSQTNPYRVMFDTLLPHFNNEKDLVNAIFHAKDNKIAKELRVYQFNKWKSANNTAQNVYNILGLKETTDNPFDNPVTLAWVDYVKFITSNDDTAASAILKVVGYNHSDKLNKLLEEAKPVSKKRKKQASNLNAPPPPNRLRNVVMNKPATESI